jgi:outer membrane protein
MNRISTLLHSLCILAVAVLYYLHFSKSSSSASADLPNHQKNQAILYLNTDSLLISYTLFQESKKQLEDKQAKLEADMQGKAQMLEKEVMQFQQQYGGMTQSQVDARKEQLGKKEQDLMALREQLANELMVDEQALNKNIYDSIQGYLKRFTAGKNIQFIMGYSPGGSVLFANDSLDITHQVIEGLNSDLKK